jgi:hypothetical protein
MRTSVTQPVAAGRDHPLLRSPCRSAWSGSDATPQSLAPPSTYSVWPVMYDASSLHRNAAVAAMSSG